MSSAPMQTYPPGARIGQYEIASLPMMGGMGVVYFALDHGNDGRPVALKTFRPELLPDRAARDRFLREGTAWIELGSHPHIVRCYKVEYIDPTAFLVLELIAKEQNMPDASLRSWLIPGRPLPLEQALLFALQIARGMQYATEKIPGFVHRDLKPENILVGADRLLGTNINRLRVTDFGLVKTIASGDVSVMADSSEDIKPNQVQFTRGVGTPLYMAPEQWNGEAVGVFTDVYAYGCILYEMLSGQRAAKGKTINELQTSHCNARLQPIPNDLPEEVTELLSRCLSLKSNQRFGAWDKVVILSERACMPYTRQAVPQAIQYVDFNLNENVQNGWSYNAMGLAYGDMAKVQVSIGYFEKASKIGRAEGVKELCCAALDNMGEAYRNSGNAKRAIELGEETLAIVQEIGYKRGEGSTLGNLGNAYLQLRAFEKSIEFFEKQLSITDDIVDQRGKSAALSNLGVAYYQKGDMPRAIGFFKRAMIIARENRNRRQQCSILNNIGEAHRKLGNKRQAIDLYKMALDIACEIGDRRTESEILGNLGSVHGDPGNTLLAIDYFNQSLVIDREIRNRHGECITLTNLGNVYAQIGEIERDIEYTEKALRISREIGDSLTAAVCTVNLGIALTQVRKTAEAISLLEQGIEDCYRIGNNSYAQFAQEKLGQLKSNNKE